MQNTLATIPLQRGEIVSLSFADCHTVCTSPDTIRSVYLVDNNVDDKDIINGEVGENSKAEFVQLDSGSFKFEVPNDIPDPNTFNKLVVETEQNEEANAFYIQPDVEVS